MTVALRQYLDQEVALSEDMVHKYSDLVLAKLNKTIGELRRLFLVEDLVDSIKVRMCEAVSPGINQQNGLIFWAEPGFNWLIKHDYQYNVSWSLSWFYNQYWI